MNFENTISDLLLPTTIINNNSIIVINMNLNKNKILILSL